MRLREAHITKIRKMAVIKINAPKKSAPRNRAQNYGSDSIVTVESAKVYPPVGPNILLKHSSGPSRHFWGGTTEIWRETSGSFVTSCDII